MKPIITCDVSKNKSHIRGYLNPETPLDKAFKIQHVKNGFKEIKSLAEKLKSLTVNLIFLLNLYFILIRVLFFRNLNFYSLN